MRGEYMPPDPDKRALRELKRAIKRRGTKARRRELKRGLAADPDGAADQEGSFGGHSSASLNGLDRDATRRRVTPPPPA
jgi:hypothetical protein